MLKTALGLAILSMAWPGQQGHVTKHRVGKMAAPVEMAMLHIHRSPYQIFDWFASAYEAMETTEKRLVQQAASPELRRKIAALHVKYRADMSRDKAPFLHLMKIMMVNQERPSPTAGSKGPKKETENRRQRRSPTAGSNGPKKETENRRQNRVPTAGPKGPRVETGYRGQEEWPRPEHLSTGTDSEILEREKRFAPIIIGLGVLAASAASAGVISLGLGISNAVEVTDMEKQLKGLRTSQEKFMVSMEERSRVVDDNFRSINSTIQQMGEEIFYNKYVAELQAQRQAQRLVVDSWLGGAYHLYQGMLDPALTTPEELTAGLQAVAARADKLGMKLVPFGSPIEALFAVPVSSIANGTGINIFITIPLMPKAAPVFDVYQLEHEPIPLGNDSFVGFDLENKFVAVGEDLGLYREITTEQLATCTRFRDLHLCRFDTFDRTAGSCSAALITGKKEQAAKICPKKLLKNDALVHRRPNSTKVDLYLNTVDVVIVVCPGRDEQSVKRMTGHQVIELDPGCYVKTDSTTTFAGMKPPPTILAVKEEVWTPHEILPGLTEEDIAHLIEQPGLAIKTVALDLTSVKHELNAHKAASSSWWAAWVAVVACAIAAAVSVLLVVLYGRWWVKSKKDPRLTYEDVTDTAQLEAEVRVARAWRESMQGQEPGEAPGGYMRPREVARELEYGGMHQYAPERPPAHESWSENEREFEEREREERERMQQQAEEGPDNPRHYRNAGQNSTTSQIHRVEAQIEGPPASAEDTGWTEAAPPLASVRTGQKASRS